MRRFTLLVVVSSCVVACSAHRSAPEPAPPPATPIAELPEILGTEIGPPPTAFPAAHFARLVYPEPERQERWGWPAPEAFEDTWAAQADATAQAWTLATGTLQVGGETDSVTLALRRLEPGVQVFSGSWNARALVEDQPLSADEFVPGATVSWTKEDRIVSFSVESVTADAEVGGTAWADWSYTSTLLASERPVFDVAKVHSKTDVFRAVKRIEAAMVESPDAGLAAIPELLRLGLDSGSRTWAQAADFAAEHGDLELAIDLRRRYWPVGRCSMDERPQREGMKFADLCYEAGRTGCYLQLQVRVMGDSVGTRNAWSSYGEASFPTYVERVAEIGVDIEPFLMGLVFDYESDEPRAVALGSWRLARAMLESGLGDRFETLLVSYAKDPDLDGFNRFRAAETLAMLRIRRMRDTLPEGARDTTKAIFQGLADDPELTDFTRDQLRRRAEG